MRQMTQKQQMGSQTAKGGFDNEHEVAKKFNAFAQDSEAQVWLGVMGYDLQRIQTLHAVHIPTRLSRKKAIQFGVSEEQLALTQRFKKADLQVQLSIMVDDVIYRENLSLKKARATANFNQIDKRPVSVYQSMWHFDDSIATTLKKFTGEIRPDAQQKLTLRDERRWYLDELDHSERTALLEFLNDNKSMIVSDILRGRGVLSAEWLLVTRQQADGSSDWVLKHMNEVVNFYAQGEIAVSARGGLVLGRLTAQRKGGTPDPTSLQFKIKPLDLFLLAV